MQDTTRTWRAWLALVTFVLALLAGAFLHPVQECDFHVCDAPSGHVERDHGPDQGHGAHACSLCHLAQTVAHATAPLPPAAPLQVAPPPARACTPVSAELASATPIRPACRSPPSA